MNYILSHSVRASMALAQRLGLRPQLVVPVVSASDLVGARDGNLLLWGMWWESPIASEVQVEAKKRGLLILEVNDDRSR